MSAPTSPDTKAVASPADIRRERILAQPVLIEVRNLSKTFHIPDQRVDTIKERVLHPRTKAAFRELNALRDISFDVHQGEFFGIVGRNGSGKSTLLKLLSSIYRPDSGTIRMAGRLAPFIELGVGFNAELTARENVALNGVMMGLSRRDAALRLDSVLDFAGLREFVDLKLKNYSSGMSVRLAFAAMVEADADVMLVDEVLAVGDASFAQKCMDVFREKRRVGKTLVFVTHDMAAVQGFCDRAMLIHDGDIRYLGDPEETALRYFRLNFGSDSDGSGVNRDPRAIPDVNVKLIDVWLTNSDGERVENVEQDAPIEFHLVVEARHDLDAPVFNFHIANADGRNVFGFSKTVMDGDRPATRIAAGRRIRIGGAIDNPLTPGRYTMNTWITRERDDGDSIALHVLRLIDFFVFGTKPGSGSIAVDMDMDVSVGERKAIT